MIKKKLYGETAKEQLKAAARDRLSNFLLADGTVRGAVLHGTRMVNEMRANHELGILETLVLGHAYMGVGLMTANLKGNDRLSIRINCSGPIKGLQAEANARGEVRGFLKNVPIPLEKPMEDFNLSPFFGAGFLSVTKSLESAKQPYTGEVMLEHGNIAQDLAAYFLNSEQTPTAFSLSIQFDKEGEVTGAGGLFLQAMPGASEATVEGLEALVQSLPSLGTAFSTGEDPMALVEETFKDYTPKFLASRGIEFFCPCNEKVVGNLLTMLPRDEAEDLMENGPFPLTTSCHNCNTLYSFDKEEIRRLCKTDG